MSPPLKPIMLWGVETVTTLTCALLAFTLPVESSGGCSIAGSRPHPQGFCGAHLAMLHRNFCFLFRMSNPGLFSDSRYKRSITTRDRRERLMGTQAATFNIPLAVLANLDLQETGSSTEASSSQYEPMRRYRSAAINFPGLLHALRKRSSRQKRDLVCDCCYRACTRDRLAMYC